MQQRVLGTILFLFMLKANVLPAQSKSADSTFALQEATVIAPRLLGQQPGSKVTTFDSTAIQVYQQQSLADLLADESPMFIRSYGLGSLAASSLRGGSANHTAVLWNGLPLSSPMNGQLDFSLVPVNLADEVYIQHGSGSALYGSGAVAGAVQLVNKAKFNQGFSASLNLSAGSFSNFRQSAKVSLSRKRFVSSLQVFNLSARNDFLYLRPSAEKQEEVRQSNAELKSQGVVNENKWLLGKGQTLNLNAWLQNTDRNIPPSILQEQSLARQKDRTLRLSAEWKFVREQFQTYIRSGWLDEILVYSDALSDIDDRTRTRQFIAESETKFHFNERHQLSAGIHNTFSLASHPNFENSPQQNRLALFTAYQYTSANKKWEGQASARTEWVDGTLVPFTYAAGVDYRLTDGLKLKANASRVYRIPTFNDLYWEPGGNPNLKPENGYAAEVGAKLRLGKRKLSFVTEITAFTRNVQDWILWLPSNGFWSPQNLMQVWSRGVESDSKFNFQLGKCTIGLGLITNYVVSTNQKSKADNDQSLGQQLIYTPMYSGLGKISLSYQRFGFTYRHNYVGYRYTSTDNTQFLAPFDLGSVMLTYRFPVKQLKSNVFFQINNLWNEQYQVLRNRAMPRIHFNTGISIQFNNS